MFFDVDRRGHLHPLSQVIYEVVKAFREIGFNVAEGPEVEDEFHNFDALNVPEHHPSRDMQDTFWLKLGDEAGRRRLLRTQTSAVQIRYLEDNPPPVKIIVPGKVFRQEATDARHEAQFFQLEGLVIDRQIGVPDLKGHLDYLFQKLYGPGAEVRFRPSFFPFVEPGFEVDVRCVACQSGNKLLSSDRCPLCGGTTWLEIGGAGLVHPQVLQAVGLSDQEWSGLAFGMGAERLAMVKHQIKDIRLFSSGDLRFINQF